jgi:type IV fimbrial biogenesis protein FimT
MTSISSLRIAKSYRMQEAGFTLVEVMVVISIVAVLASIALPSMRQFIVKTRISGIANELVGSINYARSEAIRRGQVVVICARSTPTSTVCGNTNQWDNGWIVCADLTPAANNLCTVTDANLGGLLRVRDPVGAGFTINKDGAATFLRFNADGNLTGAGFTGINIQSPDSNDLLLERTVCVARTGRARVADWSGANQVCS